MLEAKEWEDSDKEIIKDSASMAYLSIDIIILPNFIFLILIKF